MFTLPLTPPPLCAQNAHVHSLTCYVFVLCVRRRVLLRCCGQTIHEVFIICFYSLSLPSPLFGRCHSWYLWFPVKISATRAFFVTKAKAYTRISVSTLFLSIFFIFILLPARRIPPQDIGKPRNTHTNDKLSPDLIRNLVEVTCPPVRRIVTRIILMVFFDEKR